MIDDDRDTCEVMKIALEYHGFDVLCSMQAADSLTLAAKFLPDAILLDYFLPDANGGEICRMLKDSISTRHLPVILISASLLRFDPVEKFGCDAFLPKPFDLEGVVACINSVLGNARDAKTEFRSRK